MEPGKWNQGVKPAAPWWFSFDPYPYAMFLQEPKAGATKAFNNKATQFRGPNPHSHTKNMYGRRVDGNTFTVLPYSFT